MEAKVQSIRQYPEDMLGLLTDEERRTVLQGSSTDASRRCGTRCARDADCQEREEGCGKQRHCSGRGDSEARKEAEAIDGYRRLLGVRVSNLNIEQTIYQGTPLQDGRKPSLRRTASSSSAIADPFGTVSMSRTEFLQTITDLLLSDCSNPAIYICQ